MSAEMEPKERKPEIRILNHAEGETVCYPLVLLEGIIASQDFNTVGHKRLIRTSSDAESERADKLQVLDSNTEIASEVDLKESTLLVIGGDHQMMWPVIRTGFKVVVPLDIGENLIILKAMDREDISVLELRLRYTPLRISR